MIELFPEFPEEILFQRMLFWLKDEVHYSDPGFGQFILIGLYAFGTLVTAVVFGYISDRSGRRKIYVIWATIVMAVLISP